MRQTRNYTASSQTPAISQALPFNCIPNRRKSIEEPASRGTGPDTAYGIHGAPESGGESDVERGAWEGLEIGLPEPSGELTRAPERVMCSEAAYECAASCIPACVVRIVNDWGLV